MAQGIGSLDKIQTYFNAVSQCDRKQLDTFSLNLDGNHTAYYTKLLIKAIILDGEHHDVTSVFVLRARVEMTIRHAVSASIKNSAIDAPDFSSIYIRARDAIKTNQPDGENDIHMVSSQDLYSALLEDTRRVAIAGKFEGQESVVSRAEEAERQLRLLVGELAVKATASQ